MNSLVSLNWMALPLSASHDGTFDQSIRSGRGENFVPNASHSATFNQPTRHGWGESILPFEVADELHKAALTRSSLETAPSIGPPATETMTLSPRQRQVPHLPPEVPPAGTTKRPSFVGLQEWEGVVTQIHDQVFTARLIDLTHRNPDEEGEFSTTEISEDDLDLIAPGAIFRWSIGVLKMPGGGKRPISQIVFRRLPQWTKRDLLRADALAKELVHTFEQMKPPDSNDSRSLR